MRYELSEEASAQVSRAFEEAPYGSGVLPGEEAELPLFREEDERIIRTDADRDPYKARLSNGGSPERRVIKRLQKLANNHDFEVTTCKTRALIAWRKVLPPCTCNGIGCKECWHKAGAYYVRKPLNPRNNKDEFNWYTDLRVAASFSRSWDKKWFAELMLGGLPQAVSNFALECKFLLRDQRGHFVRMVKLKNVYGDVIAGPHPGGLAELDANTMCSPAKFRRWARGFGRFEWSGGATELRTLQWNIMDDTAFFPIIQG